MSSKGNHEEAHGRYLAAMSLTALGVVFGDIGTSPIYALRESFHSANGIDPTTANVLGVLSLILWSLIIVISVKYLTFVMRADNHGEGGIIALTALVSPPSQAAAQRRMALVINRVLHRRVVLLSIVTLEVPRVPDKDRLNVVKVADDLYKIVASFGFAESPDVPKILEGCEKNGLTFEMMQTTFFLSRETLVAHRTGGMAGWRQRFFALMSRNSLQATAYFGIPPHRVVELGMQVQL